MALEKMASITFAPHRLKQFCIFLCTLFARWLCGKLGLKVVAAEAAVLPQGWLMVNPALADEIGINKAIIFQGIDGWVQHNARHGKNVKAGRAWSYNTIPDWGKVFCWLNANYVGELIRQLEKDGRLVSAKLGAKPSDQTKYYSTGAGEIPDSGNQQLSFWPTENVILGGRKSQHDSSITTAKATSNAKASTAATAARGRKPLSAGAVATFPYHDPDAQERPEYRDAVPEARDFHGDPDGERGDTTPPLVPANPLPDWMPTFFSGCTEDELTKLLTDYGEATLVAARKHALNPKSRIINPAGFVRVQLARGWRPPTDEAEPERQYRDTFERLEAASTDYLLWVVSDECEFTPLNKSLAREILEARQAEGVA